MFLLLMSILLQNSYKLKHYIHNNLIKNCLHNLETLITKLNQLTRNTAPTVTEQTILSLLVSKNNEMMKTDVILIHDQNLLRNFLYNISVHPPKTKHQDMTPDQINFQIDIAVEVHLVITFREITILPIDKDLHLELVTIMIEILLLHIHYTRSRYDNYQRDSRSHRSPYRSSYRSPYTRDSRPRYKSRSHSRDNNFQKYTSSYRPPSRPRDSRYSRSRSHTNTQNKVIIIQPQSPTDPINFEIHMYHLTEMATASTPTSWFYSLYTQVLPNQTQRAYRARLEISFLLDSGASISGLNYPTYVTIEKLLNSKQNNPQNASKTLTVVNQSEVPLLHYVTLTLNTTIEDDSRQFTIPFCSSRHKIHILGTPFFEENIQNINFQYFTLQFKHHSRVHLYKINFTSIQRLPIFPYIYRINSKTQIRLKPNSSTIAHFPINNYYNLHFSTTPQNQFSLQYHILTFIQNLVQPSISLKFFFE